MVPFDLFESPTKVHSAGTLRQQLGSHRFTAEQEQARWNIMTIDDSLYLDILTNITVMKLRHLEAWS